MQALCRGPLTRQTEQVPAALRLITSVEVADPATPATAADRSLCVDARHELELADGRRVTLLDDRGWSASGPAPIWSHTSLDDVTASARAVVGPDEPVDGASYQQAEADHWAYLAAHARDRGVAIAPDDLARLPHDVEVGPGIRERLATAAPHR